MAAEGAGQESVTRLMTEAARRGIRTFELAPGVMDRVAETVTPQPVCAIVGTTDVPIESVVGPPRGAGDAGTGADCGSTGGPAFDRVVIVCLDVRDPGNLGAIVRSAGASGAAGVVCCGSSVDPYNPKAVRASAGVIFRLPVVRASDIEEVLRVLSEGGFRLIGTSPAGGTDYLEADLDGEIALLVGNEAAGLPPDIVGRLDETVTIPMTGAESLNVAMTATVLSFEAARRRATNGGESRGCDLRGAGPALSSRP